MQSSVKVLQSPITALGFGELTTLIGEWATKRESRVICVANVHMVMEAYWDPEFASILQHAEVVTPDGMPLVWMMRMLGHRSQERVAGMDLLPALCQLAEQKDLPVFLLGSTSDVLERLAQKIQKNFPTLRLAGIESPPFRPLSREEDDALVSRINASGACLVFVALGCPKQERWMHQHRERVNAVMVGLGGAFPVYAGIQRRAPGWMQAYGLEWLFRLIQEPGRLWRRYISTNLPFLWLALNQLAASTLKSRR